MTDVVFPYSCTPLVEDPDGRMLTGDAAIGNRQPSKAPTVALPGQTLLLAALTKQDGPDQDALRHACDMACPSGLSSAAMSRRRARAEEACGSWRCDER